MDFREVEVYNMETIKETKIDGNNTYRTIDRVLDVAEKVADPVIDVVLPRTGGAKSFLLKTLVSIIVGLLRKK